jgi:hypothetical protein
MSEDLTLLIECVDQKFTNDNLETLVEALTKYGIQNSDIKRVKITRARTAIIECSRETAYNKLINKNATGINANGSILALKPVDLNNTVLFKGISHDNFQKHNQDQIKEWGIVESKPLGSGRSNVTIVKCSSSDKAEDLIKLKTAIINYKECSIDRYVKRKNNVIVCFSCAKFGHISAGCVNKKQCYKCSSHEHTGPECPSKNDPSYKLICPSCKGDHPQTFPGCPAYANHSQASHTTTSQTSNNQFYRTYSSMATSSPAIPQEINNKLDILINLNTECLKRLSKVEGNIEMHHKSIQEAKSEAEIANKKADTALEILEQLMEGPENTAKFENYISKNIGNVYKPLKMRHNYFLHDSSQQYAPISSVATAYTTQAQPAFQQTHNQQYYNPYQHPQPPAQSANVDNINTSTLSDLSIDMTYNHTSNVKLYNTGLNANHHGN